MPLFLLIRIIQNEEDSIQNVGAVSLTHKSEFELFLNLISIFGCCNFCSFIRHERACVNHSFGWAHPNLHENQFFVARLYLFSQMIVPISLSLFFLQKQ